MKGSGLSAHAGGVAETGLVLADQFRDGNVPAQMERWKSRSEPLPPCQHGERVLLSGRFGLPRSHLVNWLRDEHREAGRAAHRLCHQRAPERGLHTAIQAVPEAAWEAYGSLILPRFGSAPRCRLCRGENGEENAQPLRYGPSVFASRRGTVRGRQPGAHFGVVELWSGARA